MGKPMGGWRAAAALCCGLVLLGAAAPVLAGWVDAKGRPIPEQPAMRSTGGFGVQLVLTPDAGRFVQAWNDAKTKAPQLPVSGTVRRGEAVSAMLVFYGCTKSAAGACDVAVTYTLTTPQGQKLQTGSGTVWTGPLPSDRLQLGRRSATMRFESVDAAGVYQVGALVVDKVSNRKLELRAPLRVD